jgi:hypothetical protein
MNTKYFHFFVVIGSLFYLPPTFAQQNCASISDPQAMYNCVASQRRDSQPLDDSEPLDFGKTPIISDWKKVGAITGTPATLYFSPGSAKYMKVRDSQRATGTSQVIVVYQMQDFPPQGSGVNKVSSNISTLLYHCQHPNIKTVKSVAFGDRMGKGKIVATTEAPGNKPWEGLREGDDVIRSAVLRKCPATE